MFETIGRRLLVRFEGPLIAFLIGLRLTPNRLTGIGLFLAGATGAVIALGHLRWGGLLFLVASAMDGLDGLLARGTGRVTRFGSCLDSTFDRLAEALVLLGLLFYFLRIGPLNLDVQWSIPLVYVTMAGSLSVSYVKARAEGLDLECKTGWMQRSERILILGVAMMLGIVDWALIPLAALLIVTIWQRLAFVFSQDARSANGTAA